MRKEPIRGVFDNLPEDNGLEEIKAPGKIIVPGLVVPEGAATEDAGCLAYGGGILRLNETGNVLYWRRDFDHPEICFELLLGCMIQTVDALRKATNRKGLKMRKEKADTLVKNLELVLGRKKLEPADCPATGEEGLKEEDE